MRPCSPRSPTRRAASPAWIWCAWHWSARGPPRRPWAVVTGLLEQRGQGGGCGHERRSFTYHKSFAIADPEEAWILETAERHWASERVVSGVRSISNGLTIPGFAERHSDHLKTTVSQCRERLPDAALRDPGTASPAFEPERDEMERRWLSEPPTGVTAVAEGDELLERWVERVRTAVDRDLRAPWARHYWRVRDLSAALTEDRAPVALC